MSDDKMEWSQKRYFYLFGPVAILLFGVYLYFNGARNITPTDLATLDGLVISEKPVFIDRHGKGTSPHIEFKCKGYLKRFDVTHFDYDCADDHAILTRIHTGDTIRAKILAEALPDSHEETSGSKANEIYELSCRGENYTDLACRNMAAKKDNRLGYLICFIMTPLTFAFGLLKKEPKIGNMITHPPLVLCGIVLLLLFILY